VNRIAPLPRPVLAFDNGAVLRTIAVAFGRLWLASSPASRPNKHLQKPAYQKLTLAVSGRFARLRGLTFFVMLAFVGFL
jgi:hypothetical protein